MTELRFIPQFDNHSKISIEQLGVRASGVLKISLVWASSAPASADEAGDWRNPRPPWRRRQRLDQVHMLPCAGTARRGGGCRSDGGLSELARALTAAKPRASAPRALH